MFESFYDNMDNIMIAINRSGYIEYFNKTFTKILKYDKTDLEKNTFIHFIHSDDRIKTFKVKHSLENKETSKIFNFINRYKIKNKDEYIQIKWNKWDFNNDYILCIGEIVDPNLKMLNLISENLSYYILNQKSIEDIFENLLNGILELTNSEYGFIGEVLFDEKDGLPYLRTMAITNIAWNEKLYNIFKKRSGIIFNNLNTLFGLTLSSKSLIISNSPNTDERRGGNIKIPDGHPPLRRFCGIPFFIEEKFIGMVGIANSHIDYEENIIKKYEPFFHTCALLISHIQKEKYKKEIQEIDLNFISQISHELKTPLNSILGFAQLLQLEENSNTNLEYINDIINSGQLLLNIINNSLNLNQLDNYIINKTKINLKESIDSILNLHKFSINKLGLKIINDIDPNILVICDKFLFERIIKNLISNAIKYNIPSGIIHFKSTIVLTQLYISIINSGDLKLERKFLFQPFQTTHRENGGTGLGLSIVKKIFKILDKQISCITEDNFVTFKFSLDYTKINNNSKKILYIEDNITNQKLMHKILKNYDLTILNDGTNILEIINNYDILLLDKNLPIMDGFEIINLLKKNNIIINIIMITADTNVTILEKIHKMNIKYFTKPIQIIEFRKYIDELN